MFECLGHQFASSDFVISSQTSLGFITNGQNFSNGTRAVTIDTSGNLLVDTTSASIVGNGGFAVKPQGSGTRLDISNSGGTTMLVDLRDTDGDIVGFYKDGSSVGSIGTQASQITIGNGATGLRFHGTNSDIYPWNMSTNAINNGGIDLGSAGGRFKDLYLSGGAYIGGTGSANYLDDYEEGTWTVSFSFGSFTYSNRYGWYRKIGDLITVGFAVAWSAKSGSGDVKVTLPFAAPSGANFWRATGSVGYIAGIDMAGYEQMNWTLGPGDSGVNLRLNKDNATPAISNVSNMSSQGEVQGTISYSLTQ